MPCTVGAVRGKMRSTTLRHMPETQTPAHLVAKSFSGSWVVILSHISYLIYLFVERYVSNCQYFIWALV